MSAAAPRTWLLISHAFNMDGRAASLTITDKIPHLLARGVRPIVISAISGRKDAELEHHQLLAPAPSGLRFDLRHWLNARIQDPLLLRVAKSAMQLLLLPFYAVERLLVPLDVHWSWFLPAYCRGARVIRRARPELVYSTGGASSAHLAGYLLARRFKLPWIVEVHDPMMHGDYKGNWARRRWATWVERLICEHASVAWWFTETARDRARVRNPALGERGKVMFPGANPPPAGKASWRKGQYFVLAHFGSLARNRNVAPALRAIERLVQRLPEAREQVRFVTYGGDWDSASEAAAAAFAYPEMIQRMGRLETDPVTGRSGRDRVREKMDTSDALLLLHGDDAFCEEYFPSKVYEYFWTQRPILALLWNNAELERLLAHEGHHALRADDIDGAARALEGLLRRWQRGELGDSGRASPYTAAAAVDQLVCWVGALGSEAAR